MIAATVGTVVMIGVVVTSLVIVRQTPAYEMWYAVHLLVYAGIALRLGSPDPHRQRIDG